ncbi:hypothetical protein BSL78_07495 [Apostichopus japonicus]|uniref:RING-type domain-containing protein n=1 Tax=Stichopus japonicus TaxID=307972 RepID=A0A2G8L5Q4_STIJA|nr:hypothetical protein BSL78_07495 [Apostichopus japonicus]
MADAAAGHQLKSSLRCRHCLYSLLQGDAAELEAGCSLCPQGESQSPTCIQKSIEEASWTKGKLLCLKCGGSLGSFDFTVQATRGLGLHPAVPCVHLVRSRTDRCFMASPPVARVKPFQVEEKPAGDMPLENHKVSVSLCSKHGVTGKSELHNMDLCWHSSLTKESSSLAQSSALMTNCGCEQHGRAALNDSSLAKTNTEKLNDTSSENDPFLLQMFNEDTETVTTYIANRLRDDKKERKVQYCSHSCQIYHPQVHSNCSDNKMRDKPPLAPEDTSTEPPVNGIETSDIEGAQLLLAERNPLPNARDDLSLGDASSHEATIEEELEVSSSSPPPHLQESPEDFLHGWDMLEDLEELNSSTYPSQTRAELKREKNRRKREKRKLKKRSNMYFQVLDQDIKGIPPSKFEEVTGLSLGEKTVQEYTVCAVCLDLFFNPRACSPCGHLFCEQCLRQLKRFHPTSTPCPLCRTVIQVTIPHESLNNALRKLFPAQMKQRREAHGGVKQIHPLPRTQTIPSVWLPLFSQQMTRTRNRRRMFWSLQPNSTLDYHDFGRLWVQTLRWRFTVAGYGLLALLFVCACSVLVINFV